MYFLSFPSGSKEVRRGKQGNYFERVLLRDRDEQRGLGTRLCLP